MVRQVLSDSLEGNLDPYIINEKLDMARMGISLSKTANSVAQRHNEVCHELFPEFSFDNITNGIYHPRWIGESMCELFDQHLPGWKEDPARLASAPIALTQNDLGYHRHEQKKKLCEWINSHDEYFPIEHMSEDDYLDPKILTVSFARRYVPYKRHELIFQDLEKLIDIGDGKLQIIFAGRCHDGDAFCKNVRDTVAEFARQLRGQIRIVIVNDYNLDIAHRLVTGSDIWLNTPVPPREASGTSGMKAALNGVLNLSVADGWWIEGYDKSHYAGWSFSGTEAQHNDYLNQHDAYELLLQLEDAIDCYYNHPEQWYKRMTHAIALLAEFNTHRVVKEYQEKMWS